jgi:hypothetical protein
MNGAMMLGLTLLYALPLALLALLLTAERRRPRWLMTVVLGALPLFYAGHYQVLQALQGWPSDAPVPEEFRLLAFEISEPDPAGDHDGEILLWLRATDGQPPRAHRLAYNKGLHENLITAGRLQAEGSPQIGRRNAQRRTATAGTPAVPREDAISFRTEKPPALPSKDAGN